ncbi:hypothetical protein B0H19DRAFT_99038 [Mycena capillaripes]|nr:hypothetical protein B0H19DRAFT_99038 [Mycena capillaripes]
MRKSQEKIASSIEAPSKHSRSAQSSPRPSVSAMSSLTDETLDEAAAAIRTTQSYQVSKGEAALDTAGDKFLAVRSSEVVSAAQSDTANVAYSIIKDQVSQFVENSKILVNVLDEVGKIHPFIQLAVSIFKTGIQLELTRRQNDARIVALNTIMCDMMQILTLLKKVARKDAGPVEERLGRRMGHIIESIKNCCKICDSYQRHHTALKFFMSLKWEGKFERAAQEFADLKVEIQSDLQIHISVGIDDANEALAILNRNVSIIMKMVFERMVTPEERDIARFVEKNHGKDAVLKDEKLLKQILDKQAKSQSEPKSKGQAGPAPDSPDSRVSAVSDFKRDVARDIDEILNDNRRMFEQKFETIRLSLGDLKSTVQRESDRVVGEIIANLNAGPHERIIDRDLYHIWKEMGWKANVKANHLVMAMHDHFAQKAGLALKQIRDITTNQASDAEKIQNIAELTKTTMPEEDLWTLDYITIRGIQPLIEEIDEDGSSFVTLRELNTFTTSRPEGWSLPRWIAYWTVGFEMTVQWYYRRIRRSLASLVKTSKEVLPANRLAASRFIFSSATIWIQSILAGLCNVEDFDSVDWENDQTFLKFKGWVLGNEKRMKTVLRRLSYQIDQHNSLIMVTGGYDRRPEQYILPIVYLILERACWIMEMAHGTVLDPRELTSIESSFYVIFAAASQRVDRLQSIYRFQNVDTEGKLKKVFFGLWSYALVDIQKGPSWDRDFHRDDNMPNEDNDDLEVREPPLFFDELKEEINEHAKQTSVTEDAAVADGSLAGLWTGTATRPDVFFSLNITSATPDGRFEGSGADQFGAYLVRGEVQGMSLHFLMSYQDGQRLSWRYKGEMNNRFDEISGVWGYPEMDLTRSTGDDKGREGTTEAGNNESENPSSEAAEQINGRAEEAAEDNKEKNTAVDNQEAEVGAASETTDTTQIIGIFTLFRRPGNYMLHRPTDEQSEGGRISSLWQLVRKAAKYWYRRRNLVSEGLAERRVQHRAFEELYLKGGKWGFFSTETENFQWAQLISSLDPNVIQLWRAMVLAKERRDPVQSSSCDNNCGK